jgi:hypothetical protein
MKKWKSYFSQFFIAKQNFLETKKTKSCCSQFSPSKENNISLKITTHEKHCDFTTPLHEISLKSIEIPLFLFHCDFQKMHEITIPWKCVHYKNFIGKKGNQRMLLQLISITWKALNYLYHSHHRAVLWPLLHTLKCSLKPKHAQPSKKVILRSCSNSLSCCK